MEIKDNKTIINQFKNFLDSDTTGAKATKVLLCALAISAALGFTFVAAGMGNAIQILKYTKLGKKYSRKQIEGAYFNLRRGKFVEHVSLKNGKTIVRITTKGKSVLRSFSIDLIEIKKPKRWDGKWHIVIFDFPIRFKKARNAFREKIQEMGFIQLQKSVWVYPYKCEHEILFVADFFEVGKYIEILEVNSILREYKLKNYFDLV